VFLCDLSDFVFGINECHVRVRCGQYQEAHNAQDHGISEYAHPNLCAFVSLRLFASMDALQPMCAKKHTLLKIDAFVYTWSAKHYFRHGSIWPTRI